VEKILNKTEKNLNNKFLKNWLTGWFLIFQIQRNRGIQTKKNEHHRHGQREREREREREKRRLVKDVVRKVATNLRKLLFKI